MIKCLHVYSGNMYGGVETLLVTLQKNRNLCPGLEQQFALCFEGRLSDELTGLNGVVHKLGAVRFRHPWSVTRARRRFHKLLTQDQFDVILCHSEWPLAVFGPVANKLGVPVVLWNHNLIGPLTWLHRQAQRVSPDLAISTSNTAAASVPTLFKGLRTETIYCPLSLPSVTCPDSVRNDVRRELNTRISDVVIVQTSRMETCKGHRLHLEALGQLRDLPGWCCWQAGAAQQPKQQRYFRSLKQLSTDLGIAERVRFLGERSDVSRLLAAADIHCQPNIGPEAFGIAFVEALHARLPVVTTAIGGALEIVDDNCGLLVPPQDPMALAHALRRLINDAGLRHKLGQGGPKRAGELCDTSRQLSRLECVLRSVVGSKTMEARAVAA